MKTLSRMIQQIAENALTGYSHVMFWPPDDSPEA